MIIGYNVCETLIMFDVEKISLLKFAKYSKLVFEIESQKNSKPNIGKKLYKNLFFKVFIKAIFKLSLSNK